MATLSDTLKQANADLRNILAERQAMQAQLGAYALREQLNEARIAKLESDNARLREALNKAHEEIAHALPFLSVKYGSRDTAKATLGQIRAAIAKAEGRA